MKKFKIKKNKQPLSEQEIQQNMNFDKFISGYTPPVKGWFSGGAKLFSIIASSSVVIVAAGLLVYTAIKKDKIADKPFVNPPLQSSTIPCTSFEINTNMDSTLVYSTGTIITVPANSFVDADGKDVNGNVKINYREFHDPIDILLSGIPMNYDSAGVEYQLESAGMFEITATKDDQPLFLKPDKTLKVDMISHTNNPTDYNIYSLDTVKRKWEYISENTNKNKTCIPAFEENQHRNKINTEILSTLKKPVPPRKANPNAANFSIDFDPVEFPELAVYSGLKFEPIQTENKYNPALSKKTWEDVLIEKHPDNEHYIVTFSSSTEKHSFTVLPVVDEKGYAAAMKDFASRQKQYESLLNEKRKNSDLKNDSLYRINAIFRGVAIRSNLNDRFNSFITNNYMETSKDLLALRTFSIRKLGIWNSDKPFPFFSNVMGNSTIGHYVAKFVSKDNQPLGIRNIYLIRRSVNSINSIAESQFGRFPYVNGGVDLMVGITYDNQLVFLKDSETKSVEIKGNNITFKLNKIDAGIVNPQQLKDLLKI